MLVSKPDRRRRGPPPKESSTHAISIISDDPEVKLIQGVVTGLHHMGERHMTARHFKLIMVVYLIGRVYNGVTPNRAMIATVAKVSEDDIKQELAELVDKRYLCEVIQTFGDLRTTYKLGSMGGTLMRHVMGPKTVVSVIG